MKELLREMHTWMAGYMKSFYTEDEEVQQGIRVKEEHTGYVTANMVALAKHLGLSEHDTALAEIMGLFHDVGRFHQYTLYRTFNDAHSEDHAELGVKVIGELPCFQKLSEEDYETVCFAIRHHNKKTLPADAGGRLLVFGKMLRDADKLDIYRVLNPYLSKENEDKMPNFVQGKGHPEISPDFIEDFVSGKQADFYRIRTLGDRKIVRLMWAYDVNFAWTMARIQERGYLDQIIRHLPMDANVEKGVARLKDYVAQKLRQEDRVEM